MIDFSRADREVYEGTKEATLTAFEYVPASKSSGKPAVKFTWTLSEPDVEGRKIMSTKSLQPNSLWSVKEWLVAMGADADRLSQPMTLEDFNEMGNDLLGNRCRLSLSVNRNFTDPTTGVQRDTQQVDAVLSEYAIA